MVITTGSYPSKDELNLLYLQRNVVGGYSINSFNTYWSSSETNVPNVVGAAWLQDFGDSGQGYSWKYNLHGVRAIRAF